MARKEVYLSFINLLGAEGAEIAVNKFYKKDLTDDENVEIILTALNKTKEEMREVKDKVEKSTDEAQGIQSQKAQEVKSAAAAMKRVENRYLLTLDALVGSVASGNSPALIAVSEGGLGKTTRVLTKLSSLGLTENGKDDAKAYAFSSGYTTPLELYHFLYVNREKKVIVLDDLIGAIDNPRGQTLLRAATWAQTGSGSTRIIEYHTTSNRLEVPSQFEMKAGIIILTNKVPQGEIARAFISRCLYLEMDFSDDEKLSALTEIAKQAYKQTSLKQREGVIEWLTAGGKYKTLKELNFRTLLKLFDLAYSYPNEWKSFAEQVAQEDEPKKVMREILSQDLSVADAYARWTEETGMGRASFFRYKKKLGLGASIKSQEKQDATTDTAPAPKV